MAPTRLRLVAEALLPAHAGRPGVSESCAIERVAEWFTRLPPRQRWGLHGALLAIAASHRAAGRGSFSRARPEARERWMSELCLSGFAPTRVVVEAVKIPLLLAWAGGA